MYKIRCIVFAALGFLALNDLSAQRDSVDVILMKNAKVFRGTILQHTDSLIRFYDEKVEAETNLRRADIHTVLKEARRGVGRASKRDDCKFCIAGRIDLGYLLRQQPRTGDLEGYASVNASVGALISNSVFIGGGVGYRLADPIFGKLFITLQYTPSKGKVEPLLAVRAGSAFLRNPRSDEMFYSDLRNFGFDIGLRINSSQQQGFLIYFQGEFLSFARNFGPSDNFFGLGLGYAF